MQQAQEAPLGRELAIRRRGDLKKTARDLVGGRGNNCKVDDTKQQQAAKLPVTQDLITTSIMSFNGRTYISRVELCLKFVKLMFTNPVRLGQRTARFTQAEAKVLGKVAKVLYLKKKFKKLGKKLKKHTIAVPVFTAIPIYEHSYYPQPHVTHISHGGGHMHHAAASSYSPVTIAAATSPVAMDSQQLATSASNTHQRALATAYRLGPSHHGHYSMHGSGGAHQIINAYPPAPPIYVDQNGGLYGTYGNAYGRYDGGYHIW